MLPGGTSLRRDGGGQVGVEGMDVGVGQLQTPPQPAFLGAVALRRGGGLETAM